MKTLPSLVNFIEEYTCQCNPIPGFEFYIIYLQIDLRCTCQIGRNLFICSEVGLQKFFLILKVILYVLLSIFSIFKLCENHNGGYSCLCVTPGYRLSEDRHACYPSITCRNLTMIDAPDNGGLVCYWYTILHYAGTHLMIAGICIYI